MLYVLRLKFPVILLINSALNKLLHGRRAGLGAGVPFKNIKGRAMFVWLSFGPGGAFASDRLMVNVMGKPTLPSGYESLQAGVDRCLRERPAQTTPPPSK